MVEPLATVAPLNMHVSPDGIILIGESPTEHGIRRLDHFPVGSQRNCVPAWQLAEPGANEIPAKSHVRLTTISGAAAGPHAREVESHSPSSQRYSRPL